MSTTLVGVAAWLTLSAFLPEGDPPGSPVVVVRRDLPAGHLVAASDLQLRRWPAADLPSGVLQRTRDAVGQRLAGPMSGGEPLTPARLRGRGLLTGLPADLVATHVSLTDPQMAALLSAGDRVDVIADAKRVATDVLVLSGGAGTATAGWRDAGADPGAEPGVLLAVTPIVAERIAGATRPDQPGPSALTLVLRP